MISTSIFSDNYTSVSKLTPFLSRTFDWTSLIKSEYLRLWPFHCSQWSCVLEWYLRTPTVMPFSRFLQQVFGCCPGKFLKIDPALGKSRGCFSCRHCKISFILSLILERSPFFNLNRPHYYCPRRQGCFSIAKRYSSLFTSFLTMSASSKINDSITSFILCRMRQRSSIKLLRHCLEYRHKIPDR